MNTITHHGDTFEVVETYPIGYEIWNIHMLEGYVPFCRPLPKQPFDGARQIDVSSLRAMKSEGASIIMEAANSGCTTVKQMEAYLAKHRNPKFGTYESCLCGLIERALPYLKELEDRI